MKLRFKHQGFQVEAARNVVRAFQGQPYLDRIDYIMDMGKGQSNQLFTDTGLAMPPCV